MLWVVKGLTLGPLQLCLPRICARHIRAKPPTWELAIGTSVACPPHQTQRCQAQTEHYNTEQHGQVISLIANEPQAPRSQRQYSILCQKNCSAILKDSRTYEGSDLNSDHKPVITRLKMARLHLMHKHHIKGACEARTDIDKPCKDPLIQESYQEQLHNTLTKHHIEPGPK